MRISDWSSDVCSSDLIKVEPAPGGDKTRRLPGFAAGFFLTFNRNKRSIALDLKSDEGRSEEHTSELQSLMRISYAVFCLKKKTYTEENINHIDRAQCRNARNTCEINSIQSITQ